MPPRRVRHGQFRCAHASACPAAAGRRHARRGAPPRVRGRHKLAAARLRCRSSERRLNRRCGSGLNCRCSGCGRSRDRSSGCRRSHRTTRVTRAFPYSLTAALRHLPNRCASRFTASGTVGAQRPKQRHRLMCLTPHPRRLPFARQLLFERRQAGCNRGIATVLAAKVEVEPKPSVEMRLMAEVYLRRNHGCLEARCDVGRGLEHGQKPCCGISRMIRGYPGARQAGRSACPPGYPVLSYPETT